MNNKQRSGIFLLYEGLPPTIIESQVLAHVRSMGDVGIHMEVWTFAATRNAYAEGLAALPRLQNSFPTVKIRLFRGFRPALPFSEWYNVCLLLFWLWWLQVLPSFIHARTEHATAIAAIAKPIMNFWLIWDARGDTLSEFKAAPPRLPSILKWLLPFKKIAISKRLSAANRHCDAAIFVSNALQNLQGRTLPVGRTLVVPCLADESLFYFDPGLRESARQKLHYKDTDVVIVYVGSNTVWQCIPETIAIMEQVLRGSNACKALVVTPNVNEFTERFSLDLRDRIFVTSGGLGEMNQYMNAADFGILLRKIDPINKVASPVKFAEYSLTGLVVLATDAVDQVTTIGKSLGNIVSKDEFADLCKKGKAKGIERNELATKAKELCGRNAYIEKLVKFYNLSQS
jgi:hypothetical protein